MLLLNLYEIILFIIYIFINIIFPKNFIKIKKFYFYLRKFKKENKSYALTIFTLFSVIIFLWFYNSWRELFAWIYRTQFGDIAEATNTSSNFIDMPNSILDVFQIL